MKLMRGSLFLGALAAAFGLAAVCAEAQSHQAKTNSEVHSAAKARTATAISNDKTEGNAILGEKETLSGTLVMVDPSQNLVVVKDSGDIPFDFKVTKHTKIELNQQQIRLAALKDHVQGTVTIEFIPRGQGDFARQIQLKAG